MSNLLPQKEIQKNKMQTWVRMYSIFCAGFGAVMLAGFIMIIPSYFFVAVATDAVESKSAILEKRAENTPSETSATLRLLKDEMRILKSTTEHQISTAILVVESILDDFDKNISLSAYVYTAPEANKGALSELRISGFADTRESIVAFVDALEEEVLFADVTIPVSSLAFGGEFTVIIQGKF